MTTTTFSYTGSAQTWLVPTGVTVVTVDAKGAQGGAGNGVAYDLGGKGGRVVCDLIVTPGETLQINVGGMGLAKTGSLTSGAGGFNGGGTGGAGPGPAGGGGGASDVRRGAYALADRLVIGPGGGGMGGNDSKTNAAGFGGTPTGGTGATSDFGGILGGAGGTAGAGGAQGANGTPGTAGTLGLGGNGGTPRSGGGGGGGLYGGGGGGGSVTAGQAGGGGGGGSGLSTGTNETIVDGDRFGEGEVILTWTGAVTIEPTSIASTASVGSPTVTIQPLISPTSIASTASVGSPTITVGAVEQEPTTGASAPTAGFIPMTNFGTDDFDGYSGDDVFPGDDIFPI